jgi:V/A-type H+-transporting ATPase subunit A
MKTEGKIVWISGEAIKSEGMSKAKMYETVEVGEDRMIGEIIRLTGDVAFIQVYESTSGLRPGEPVYPTGKPLSVELGPGMMGTIYDGLQRPLDKIAKKVGDFIKRGVSILPIPHDTKWHLKPTVKVGENIEPGSILGLVQETPLIEHRVMVPPDHMGGKVKDVVVEGDYNVDEPIVQLEKNGTKSELKMYQNWPVRKSRPCRERLDPNVP